MEVYREYSFLYRTEAWWLTITGARDSGKTFAVIQFFNYLLMNLGKNAEIAFASTTLKQAKDTVEPAMNAVFEAFPAWRDVCTYNAMDGKYTFRIGKTDRRILRLFGYEDIKTKRGYHPHAVAIDEAAGITDAILAVLIPMIGEDSFRKGGKVILLGTVYGKDRFYDQYQRGLDPAYDRQESYMVKGSQCHKFSAEFLEFQRKNLGETAFAREYECDWNASYSDASVYGDSMRLAQERGGISTHHTYDPRLPVYTGWDFGYSHLTSIWFFQIQSSIPVFIDYYENSKELIPHYVKILKKKGYDYSMAFIPWDGGRGDQRAPMTLSDQLTNHGIVNTVFDNDESVLLGIDRCKTFLKVCLFNSELCSIGINGLKQHEWKYDKDRGDYVREQVKTTLDTDRADAFRISCRGLVEIMDSSPSGGYSREYTEIATDIDLLKGTSDYSFC